MTPYLYFIIRELESHKPHGTVKKKFLIKFKKKGCKPLRAGIWVDSLQQLSTQERYTCCSVTQSRLTLCNHMDYTKPGLPVPHYFLKFAQIHVHCISDAIQPSHPLTSSSCSALNLCQHQGLFQRVNCSHQMTKILDLAW